MLLIDFVFSQNKAVLVYRSKGDDRPRVALVSPLTTKLWVIRLWLTEGFVSEDDIWIWDGTGYIYDELDQPIQAIYSLSDPVTWLLAN